MGGDHLSRDHCSKPNSETSMKKLALIAALTLASVSAHAATYVDGKNRVVIPDGCRSWSCISVSVPGHYSYNVQPTTKTHARHADATAAATAGTSAPAATTAQVVSSAPAATTTQH
jgi:hypothetical protein